MHRRIRAIAAVLAVSLVMAACTTQSRPDYSEFEVPTEIVPDSLVASDPRAVLPSSGVCTVSVGTGARVLAIESGSLADGSLLAGDIITSVDDITIYSHEQLVTLLQSYDEGAVVTVAGERAVGAFSVEVPIQLADEGTSFVDLGISSESRLEQAATSDIGSIGSGVDLVRPVLIDGQLYFHEPVAGVWESYPGIPTATLAGLEEEIYTLTEDDRHAVVNIGSGEVISIEIQSLLLPGAGDLTLESSVFVRILASVGGVLIVGGEATDGEVIARLLYGIDVETGQIAWAAPFQFAQNGNARIPTIGYRSPDGRRVAVGVQERDAATGATSDAVEYLLYNSAGASSSVPGSDSVPPTAAVLGWYDNETLAYLLATDGVQLISWNTRTGIRTLEMVISGEDLTGLVNIEPVGDGRHVVLIYETETWLYDVIGRTIQRVLTRGCSYSPLTGLSG